MSLLLTHPQALQINGMQLGHGAVRVTRSRTAMNPVKQEFLPRSVGRSGRWPLTVSCVLQKCACSTCAI